MRTGNCRGYGFLTIYNVDLLDPALATQTLNEYVKVKPFETTTRGGRPVQTTLLFSFETEGQQASREFLNSNKIVKTGKDESIGAKLREMGEQAGGTMRLDKWPMADRKTINDRGKVRNLKPKAAAVAAGIHWDGPTGMFSIAKSAGGDLSIANDVALNGAVRSSPYPPLLCQLQQDEQQRVIFVGFFVLSPNCNVPNGFFIVRCS
jgi:hypothetical protein